MGQDGVDTDLPTQLELLCLNNILGKIFFSYVVCDLVVAFVPHRLHLEHSRYYFTLSDRHSSIRSASQRVTRWHLLNILAQLVFDFALLATFGIISLVYLIMSSFFAGAGHFIAEHYLWDGMEM